MNVTVGRLDLFAKQLGWWLLALSVYLLLACPAVYCSESLYLQARSAESSEKFDDAVDLYKRSMTEEPSNYEFSANGLIHVLTRLHRYEEAEQVVDDLARQTHQTSYRLKLADIYRMSGNHYAAQRQYQEILTMEPDNVPALVSLGQSYEATGDYERARESYSTAMSKSGPEADIARGYLEKLSKLVPAHATIDGDTSIGFWMPSRMPLKVSIGSTSPGTEVGLPVVRRCLEEWNSSAHGTVELELCDDPHKADITIVCVASLPSKYHALGVTTPTSVKKVVIDHADILIATNVDSSGRTLPPQSTATTKLYESRDRMMHQVVLHEIGHALGLNHSAKRDDIMADGIFGLTSADIMNDPCLTPSDINRLMTLYGKRDRAIALAKEYLAKHAAANEANKADPTAWVSQAGLVDSDSAVPSGAEGESNDDSPNADGTTSNGTTQSGTRRYVYTSMTNPVGSTLKGDIMSHTGTQRAPASFASASLRSVVFNLRMGNYDTCLKDLNVLLITEPNNAEAHYLEAVALVGMRRYDEAAKQYKEVLNLQPQGKLATLATSGLAKLGK